MHFLYGLLRISEDEFGRFPNSWFTETIGCPHQTFLGISEVLLEMLEKSHITAGEAVYGLPVITDTEEFCERLIPTKRLKEMISIQRNVLEFIDEDVVVVRSMPIVAQA